MKPDGVLGQARAAVAARHFAREHGAHGAVHVADGQAELDRGAPLQRFPRVIDQLVVQRLLQAVVLGDGTAAGDPAWHWRTVKDRRKVQSARLPVIQGLVHLEPVDAPDGFVHGAKAELRQPLAYLLGHEEEVVDEVLGLALELGPQRRVLGGNTHRAGIQVALAHHHAAQADERHGGEAELLGAEQRGDHDVAAGLQFAVGLHAHAAAQIVHHQHLLGFGQAQLPRRAGVLDGGERRGAGAAVVPADEHHVGMGFGHARRDDAHADLGHQFHRDARGRVDVLKVVDELGQIFDRVDVVVRRRRDQLHAGNRVADARDGLVHLMAGKLAALAGFGALGDLDLQLVGVHQVVGGDAEAARGHLLHRAAQFRPEAGFVLAALAGVGAPANAVHGDGHGLMRFLADRAVGHGAGREALDDFGGRLDLLERDGPRVHANIDQPAQRAQVPALVVDQRRVFLVGLVAALPHRML